ncbi:MAG TPA: 3-oxoacid CoA-transferase subunit B [Stellaceae bacterium]|nr:3-oxoacid CoA-transferase subunit B [Stellaceae bacterium]
MTSESKGLTRQQMCDRLAMEFGDGWIVNLGVGIPTLCSNFDFGSKQIIFHSENGVIGYGPLAARGKEDAHLVNAGGQHVTLHPWGSIVHHADAFAMIRGGRIDATVLGAYEVAANGDFANWRAAGQKGGGIGGAMDLAAGAKRVFVVMEHQTRDGRPRLVHSCSLPLTAPAAVKLVATNFGLFEPVGDGFLLREIAPGIELAEIEAATGANLHVSQNLAPVRLEGQRL